MAPTTSRFAGRDVSEATPERNPVKNRRVADRIEVNGATISADGERGIQHV